MWDCMDCAFYKDCRDDWQTSLKIAKSVGCTLFDALIICISFDGATKPTRCQQLFWHHSSPDAGRVKLTDHVNCNVTPEVVKKKKKCAIKVEVYLLFSCFWHIFPSHAPSKWD